MATILHPLESIQLAVPVAKSPKKRPEDASDDLEKPPVVCKRTLLNFTDRSTRSQTIKVEERDDKPPRETSPEIVQIVEIAKPAAGEGRKKAPVHRKQLKITDAFSTPSKKAGASTKTVLTESITKIMNDNSGGSPKSPGLNASHHMATPEAAAVKVKKPTTLRNSFLVRKSARVDEKLKKEKEDEDFPKRILAGEEDPRIEIKVFEAKGRGLVANDRIRKGEYVVEYSGDLITDPDVAKQKEEFYALHPDAYGCYMYYFKHRGKDLCVDATAETKRYGRLLNHSIAQANLRTEVLEIEKRPYLIMRAKKDIAAGEELLYDYGDTNAASLAAFPWLRK